MLPNLNKGDRNIYDDILYQLTLGNETVLVLRGLNPTPNPDGTRKEYFLWCDSQLRPIVNEIPTGAPQKLTAWNAVAASWGMRGEDFKPAQRA